jgi:hypothetical protein
MKSHASAILAAGACALLAACGAPPGPGDNLNGGELSTAPVGLPDGTTAEGSVTYQQGLNGYSGARSVDISDMYLGQSGNTNGMTFGDSKNDWCIGRLHGNPGFGYDISPLLRLEGLALPAGKVVLAASLTMTLTSWDNSGARVVGRYLNQDWEAAINDPSGGLSNAPVGWVFRKAGEMWATAGARGEGSDLVAGKQFLLPGEGGTIGASGKQQLTTWLHPEVVQRWIDTPGQNFGVVMQVDVSDVHIGITQPNRPAQSETPRLVIYYR